MAECITRATMPFVASRWMSSPSLPRPTRGIKSNQIKPQIKSNQIKSNQRLRYPLLAVLKMLFRVLILFYREDDQRSRADACRARNGVRLVTSARMPTDRWVRVVGPTCAGDGVSVCAAGARSGRAGGAVCALVCLFAHARARTGVLEYGGRCGRGRALTRRPSPRCTGHTHTYSAGTIGAEAARTTPGSMSAVHLRA